MRMQLRIILLILIVPFCLQAQKSKTLDETEVNFLFNYYNQDGDHSPVSGGIGTEALDCFSPVIMINVPIDTVHNVSVVYGVDYYTSASSDKIDRFITSASSQYLSAASGKDLRNHVDLGYTYTNEKKRYSAGIMVGYSKEFDVTSFSGGFILSKTTKNENTEFSLKGSLFHDTWKLIYPGEIRNGDNYRFGNSEDDYDLDTRLTTTLSFSYMQVITKKLHLLFITDFVMQRGLLHTPFHRVYFDDGFEFPDSLLFIKTMFPENLPSERNKLPMGLRLNYYLNDRIVVRTFYRFYIDDFGMIAHTANIELPVKLTPWLTVYPMFRYHSQSASKYFAPFAAHQIDFTTWTPVNEYYTSDWDQAKLVNLKFGGGFKLYPQKGLANVKLGKNKIHIRYLDLRYARYQRNDGLKANSVSIDLGVKL